jgi:hypothetical protein
VSYSPNTTGSNYVTFFLQKAPPFALFCPHLPLRHINFTVT